jgi:hypothetical protein
MKRWKPERREGAIKKFEERLNKRLEKYRDLLEKVQMPPEKWYRAQKREFVAEQLIKMGVNKYVAYALAVRKIKE